MDVKKYQWPNWTSLNNFIFSGYVEDLNILQDFILQMNQNNKLFEEHFCKWFSGHNVFPDPSDIRARVLFLPAPNNPHSMVILNLDNVSKANQAMIACWNNFVVKICGSPREAFNYIRTRATQHSWAFLEPYYIGPGFYAETLVFVIIMKMGSSLNWTTSEIFSKRLLDIMQTEPYIVILDLNPGNMLDFDGNLLFIDLDIMFHLSNNWKEIMLPSKSTIEVEYFTEGLSLSTPLILLGLPDLWQFKDGFNMALVIGQCFSVFWFRFVMIENCEDFLSLLGITGKNMTSIAQITQKQQNDIWTFQLMQLISSDCEFFSESRFPAFGQFMTEIKRCLSLDIIPSPKEIVRVAQNIYEQNRHDYPVRHRTICPTPIVNNPKLRGKIGATVLPFMATVSELNLTFGTDPVVTLIYLHQILEEVQRNELFLIAPQQPKNAPTVLITSLEFLHIYLPISQSKRFVTENISRHEKYFNLKNVKTTLLCTKEKISPQQIGFISDDLAKKCGFTKGFLCQIIFLNFLENHNFWNIGQTII